MKFTLEIESNNAGMTDAPALAVAMILDDVTTRVQAGSLAGFVRDHNGNQVGVFRLTYDACEVCGTPVPHGCAIVGGMSRCELHEEVVLGDDDDD